MIKKYLMVIWFLVLSTANALAEDIDLYVNQANISAETPNVLLLVDNTANWNTAFNNEMNALRAVFNALPADKFRVGIMFANETGNPNNNVSGGYVRAAIRTMTSENKTLYRNMINSFDSNADKGNGGISSLVMAEAYLYLSGGTPYAGNGKVKTDFAGNTNGVASNRAVYALPGNALSSKDATGYNTPVTSGCQKNFIIYLSNGPSQDNNSVISKSNSLLSAANGDTTSIPISPSGSMDNPVDEWARFMKKSSLNVVTYTIDIDKSTTGAGPAWTAALRSMAAVSSGKYFDISSESNAGADIATTLLKIFSEIQDVNSVFSSASLPASTATQGTYTNQLFYGMFRPDPAAMPRWVGNLKQYKFDIVNGTLKLVDADGNDPINSRTGFFAPCSRSFWSSANNYWYWKPQGNCGIAHSDVSDSPDGNIVEKGGQAQQMRAASSRIVKTCASDFSACTGLVDFNATNVTQANLGVTTATAHTQLINWALGWDVQDENNNGRKDTDANSTQGSPATREMRPSVHADTVHSRPVAINYGSDTSPQVVVYYGTNDGMLHAVNGNRASNMGSVVPGGELWSFMAPEFFSNIKRLYDNTEQVKFYGSTTGTPKPYGFDGNLAYLTSGSIVNLYATMRRGGRVLYAFDVSDRFNPKLKWKKGCPSLANDTGCSSGFTGIGQTWSTPQFFKAQGYDSGASSLLIMGGGYDNCEDSDPHSCTGATKGNHIYVMDANTGALLKTFDTTRGVTGEVKVVRDSQTKLALYAYASDLGGNIYRIDMLSATPGNWTMKKIASLGCATTTSCAANRKFMYGPDVVFETSGSYLITIGSGDREKPLLSYSSAASVANNFFVLRDKPADSTWLSDEHSSGGNCGADLLCLNSLAATSVSSTTPLPKDWNGKKGWYMSLAAHEQVVTASITLYSNVTFSTHTPYAPGSTNTCEPNLGRSRVYNINIDTGGASYGTSRFRVNLAGGLAPSPMAARVQLDDGTTKVVIVGAGGESVDGGLPQETPSSQTPPPCTDTFGGCEVVPPGVGSRPRSRVYWYLQQ